MDYFRLLCIDLISKRVNPSVVTGWEKNIAFKFEQFATNDGVYKQEVIGGKRDKNGELEIAGSFEDNIINEIDLEEKLANSKGGIFVF